jgi:hypothetical protein
VPSFGPRIRPVLDLEPSISTVFVNPQLSLRHYPFQIATANLFEKPFALALDVLGKQQSFTIARLYEVSELALPLDERELPKVFSVEPQQVECVQDGFGLAVQKLIESAYALHQGRRFRRQGWHSAQATWRGPPLVTRTGDS